MLLNVSRRSVHVWREKAKRAVVTVGDGRGFVVESSLGRLIITAARCLPFLPLPHSTSNLERGTCPAVLGPLGQTPTVWAECCFLDPIADLAVLGGPDEQDLYEQWDAYNTFMNSLTALPVARPSKVEPALLLSRSGRWFGCLVRNVGGLLRVTDATEPIVGAMSGSPIVSMHGAAIGALSILAGVGGSGAQAERYSPCLFHHLPAGILRDLNKRRRGRSATRRR